MVKDRMAEFRAQAPPPDNKLQIEEDDEEDEYDSEEEEEEEVDEDMEDFYADVGDIKQGLVRFHQNIEELDQITTSQIAQGKSKEKDHIESMLSETTQLANILRNKLKGMKEQINELSQENPSANVRIRVNIQQTLTKRFLDLMRKYQEVQTTYESNFRSKMKLQIGIIHPDKSGEEVDRMIDRGEVGNLLQDNVLEDRREHAEAAMALIHLKEQHRDIMQLEQSIMELHQIFVDIAALIEAQDELVDQIEWNCEQACAWTGEAVKEIKKANIYVKKDRKRCCGCCACAGGAVCATCTAGLGYLALTLAPMAACSVM